MKRLSWVKAGILLALLEVFAYWSYKPLGVSTSYSVTVGLIAKALSPDFVASNQYFQEVKPQVDWEWMLTLGMVIGGLLGALVAREWRVRSVPDMWGQRWGYRPARRFLYAFVGGFLILFGARLAGGCTSGHIISGGSQLAVSSILFGAGTFMVGVISAKMLYGGQR